MRDRRFVAEHRNGPLKMAEHRQLMKWAIKCVAHVLNLLTHEPDERLVYALSVAKDWAEGKAATGQAMKASLLAHAVARESGNEIAKAIARAVGQAVATAHMADHSLGAALYALRAINQAGKSITAERKWQHKQLQQLPPAIIELVLTTMEIKEQHFKF